ncbi:YaiI/YqxD family protein [Thiotrichales bacterium 19S9-12]|nr:YaiI/YqxD family protein [Thiotrichales bacterium 19S9-11]MCF6810873.1 YaiI/YqxD family protein [Thiotrichales bacterium 19S9-12]
MFKIFIDADACPKAIKEVVFKAAINRKILTILVANKILNHPDSKFIQSKVVSKGFDVADNYIVEQVEKNDLVITSDIPLANDVIEKGAYVITSYGRVYDKNNIKPALAKRNFFTQMRDSGLMESKTRAFSNKEIYNFSTAFDRYVSQFIK